ncbi:IS200/IS605 family transposase [Bacteroides sp. 519]|uniref:IS200/IS605 family transposase n=1 Tax=Bacteroides sp. 519 TaxID=2302937 RepID=UPI0013D665A8|nr:IS200/IS605 family transposase [Bacteroides sp. 519]NDV58868.1 IS200/IS605 family transposase [Bacteroides sp. 519]
MPQSLSSIYVHITFSTKNRISLLKDDEINASLYNFLGGICKEMKCNPIQIGGHTDHIHILCLLGRETTIAKLVENLKKRSSLWIKDFGNNYQKFYWQEGYGAFSVNSTETDKVINYILNQKEHHRKWTFQDEYRAFLHKYNVKYDEQYVWD